MRKHAIAWQTTLACIVLATGCRSTGTDSYSAMDLEADVAWLSLLYEQPSGVIELPDGRGIVTLGSTRRRWERIEAQDVRAIPELVRIARSNNRLILTALVGIAEVVTNDRARRLSQGDKTAPFSIVWRGVKLVTLWPTGEGLIRPFPLGSDEDRRELLDFMVAWLKANGYLPKAAEGQVPGQDASEQTE